MSEWFDVVDKNDRVIGKARRSECHGNPNLRHRAVGIMIFNSGGELLLQKRSMKKDLYKGVWALSASGHVDSGEEYEKTAERELMEELGINARLEYVFTVNFSGKDETEIGKVYIARHDGPFNPDPDEIDEVRFFPMERIEDIIKNTPGMITPFGVIVLKEYIRRFGIRPV